MTPREALDIIDSAGVILRAEGGHLFASPTPIPDDIVALIRQHKPALLGLVRNRAAAYAAVEEMRAFFPIPDPSGEMGPDLEAWVLPDGTAVAMVAGLMAEWKAIRRHRLAVRQAEAEAEEAQEAQGPQRTAEAAQLPRPRQADLLAFEAGSR